MPDTIVVAGGGHAAAQVVDSLRRDGYSGQLVMACGEPVIPYQRPPLSKKFLAGELEAERLPIRPASFYEHMRCEMLLYMASRAQMMQEKILPALEAGLVVISDRFVSSTLAYQLGGDGLSAQEIRRVGEIAIRGRWPDLTLVFDLPVEASQARVRPKFSLFPDDPRAGMDLDRIEQRSLAYHDQVRKNYLEQVKLDPGRYRVIDAMRPAQQVHEDVLVAVGSV